MNNEELLKETMRDIRETALEHFAGVPSKESLRAFMLDISVMAKLALEDTEDTSVMDNKRWFEPKEQDDEAMKEAYIKWDKWINEDPFPGAEGFEKGWGSACKWMEDN